jgi:hypothetical protein
MAELPGPIERYVFALFAVKSKGLFIGVVGVKMRSWRKCILVKDFEIVPIGLGLGKRHYRKKLRTEGLSNTAES